MPHDWIATFPLVFREDQRTVLGTVEKSGFEKGLQAAARIAANYALEDDKVDSLCREIAREIMAQGPSEWK